MLASGTLLQNRYRIVRRIGQGGMGAVYEALHEELGQTVALKETFHADNEVLRKAFRREARLLAGLEHPALPKVMDYFTDDEGLFLVMQYVAGDDLAARLARRNGPFPVDEVIGWALQLLDVIEYLHSQDPPILHRDIKPSNVKLTDRGQIKLLDFGLAKGAISGQSSVVTTHSLLGYTLSYSPLEQILRADAALAEHLSVFDAGKVNHVLKTGVDQRSDLYSLGATLYHLLTAQIPMQAPTRALSLWSGRLDPLLAAHQINREVPISLSSLLASATALEVDDRPPSAAELRSFLLGMTRPQVRENLTIPVTSPKILAPDQNQGVPPVSFEQGFQHFARAPVVTDPQYQIQTDIPTHPRPANPLHSSPMPQGNARRRSLLYTSIVILALLSFSAIAIGITYFLDGSWNKPVSNNNSQTTNSHLSAGTGTTSVDSSNANRQPIAGSNQNMALPTVSNANKKDQNKNSAVIPDDVVAVTPKGKEANSGEEVQNANPGTQKRVVGFLDLSGTLKFDRLLAIEVEPKIQVGDYTSRRDGNTFYVTIRNARLEGRSSMPGGGAIFSADLHQRGNDVVMTVKMKDGCKTWVWRNNSLLVQIGNNR